MNRPDVAERFLVDRRRSAIGWSLGILAYLGLITTLWTVIRDTETFQDIAEEMPEAIAALFGSGEFDLASAGGFLNTYVYGLMLPLFLIIAGIGAGAATIGGEEENGTLELLLSHPVGRRRVVAEKALAIAGYLCMFAFVAFAIVALLAPAVSMDLPTGNIAAATLGALLVSVAFAMLALAAGAVTGQGGRATGVAATIAAASYLVQVVAQLVDSAEGLRFLSPLYLANGTKPIENGVPLGEYLGLAGIVVVLAFLSAVALDRRDLHA